MDEIKVLEAIKKGDKKAFEVIVNRYHNELFYTALGILHSSWDALDICQETFLKVYTAISGLKDITKFRVWVNRILVNKCMDSFRKNSRLSFVDDIEKEGVIEEWNIENLDLINALASIKEEHRIVITLRYFQDLPLKEIAEIVGCPEGTVKSRLSYALKELRKIMEDKPDLEVKR